MQRRTQGNRTSKKEIIREKADKTNCNKSKLKLASGLLHSTYLFLQVMESMKEVLLNF